MYDQPRYEPLEASRLFSDGLSARPPVEGTVARGQLKEDEAFHFGREGGRPVRSIPDAALHATYDRDPQRFAESFAKADPIALRRALLERGRERYDIYCSPCHGLTGDGDGMIVRRGFRRPPSYHDDRLRQAAAGYFYDVMSNGFGAMAPYASRIRAEDRWAIVAYIRALQLSTHVPVDELSEEQRAVLPNADEPTPRREGPP